MSVEAITWVLHEAPGCPPQLVSTLIGLANHADPHGRGAYPGQGMLASYTRKSERQVRRDLAEAERLGLIRRGDQRLVAHIPADRRPVVWDLVMAPRRPRADLDGRTSASARTSASGRGWPAEQAEPPVDNRPGDLDGGTPMSAPGGHPRPLAGDTHVLLTERENHQKNREKNPRFSPQATQSAVTREPPGRLRRNPGDRAGDSQQLSRSWPASRATAPSWAPDSAGRSSRWPATLSPTATAVTRSPTTPTW